MRKAWAITSILFGPTIYFSTLIVVGNMAYIRSSSDPAIQISYIGVLDLQASERTPSRNTPWATSRLPGSKAYAPRFWLVPPSHVAVKTFRWILLRSKRKFYMVYQINVLLRCSKTELITKIRRAFYDCFDNVLPKSTFSRFTYFVAILRQLWRYLKADILRFCRNCWK